MHDQPSVIELVEAVRGFIAEQARPALSGRAAFHARVAENVLAIVARELQAGAAADAAAKSRLLDLLGAPEATSLDALNTQLSDAIRAGTMDETTPGLLDHLRSSTIDQVKIDQPHYSGLKTAMVRGHE